MITTELLNKIDKEIDELLASETPESLAKWLENSRMERLVETIGSGSFKNLRSAVGTITGGNFRANYNSKNISADDNPINRRAA